MKIIFALRVQLLAAILEQRQTEPIDAAQRAPQVMRHRIAERLQFLIRGGQFGVENRQFATVALHALGVRPEDSMMVGDSERDDVDGAHAAGMRAVLLQRDPERAPSSVADATIRGLPEIPRMLKEFGRL